MKSPSKLGSDFFSSTVKLNARREIQEKISE